ncbi:hypothetical protein [Tenggerimyces flavus]|uniref:Polyketide cyclase/dehydrase n=1 Tax=Tenggerimyces flavus TaxID=1708749 RepID=A0ABV7Y8K7_9ACTN|nr:hypothetical protein [Tenggerimyces flavus]MBM7785612.1 hypothetical protein [Tenggerimyces flavus]
MSEHQVEAEQEQSRRPNRYQWALAGLLAAVGVAAFGWMWQTGRADSAMLFVGLPMLLAVVLILAPAATGHGRAFQLTTILLLVTAALFHEGAICVILAAPIVYAIVHGVVAAVRGPHARRHGLLLIPVLLVASLEGASPDLRVDPHQAITVTRTVALSSEQVRARMEQGPKPTDVRSPALKLLHVPMPHHVTGEGLDAGDRWTFDYHGGSHGPGGATRTRVTKTTATSVEFGVEENTTITARWVGLERAVVSWQAVGGKTQVRLTIWYERKLDPSWYFGPLQQAFMHEGATYLLDSLALR